MQKRVKVIKNTTKILVIVLLISIALSIVGYFVIANKHVQTHIVNRKLSDLAEKLDADIKINKVELSLFKDIHLHGVLIKDQQKDTLLYIPKLVLGLSKRELLHKRVEISQIMLDEPFVQILERNDEKYNFQFLIDSFPKSDTSSNWSINLSKINLDNGRFKFQSSTNKITKSGNIDLQNLNVKLQVDALKKDSLIIALKQLDFEEPSMFLLKQLKGKLKFVEGNLELNKLICKTERSLIDIPYCSLSNFNNGKLRNDSEISFNFGTTKISPVDFVFLNAEIGEVRDLVELQGDIQGRMDNLKFDNLKLIVDGIIEAKCNAQVMDVFAGNEAYFFADFKALNVQTEKLVDVIERFEKKKIGARDQIKALKYVDYKGSVSGFPSQLIAYGDFMTGLGNISSDISVEADVKTGKISYASGFLGAQGFNLNPFTKHHELLGEVTFEAKLQSVFESDSSFGVQMEAFIKNIEANGYTYSNVDMNGILTPLKFNGAIGVQDPNLDFIFYGGIDFSTSIPALNFHADIDKANLNALNLDTLFTSSHVSLVLDAGLIGNNLDNFEGFFRVSDVDYRNSNGRVELDSIRIAFMPNLQVPEISIQSDLVNGSVVGEYHFVSFKETINKLFSQYLPAITPVNKKLNYELPAHNNFKFNLVVNPLDSIARIFELPYAIYSKSVINGELSSKTDLLDVSVDMPLAALNKTVIEGLNFNLTNRETRDLHFRTKLDQFTMGERAIQNVMFKSSIKNNSVDAQLVWNSNSEETNSGNIQSHFNLDRNAAKEFIALMDVIPSTIILADSVWNLPKSQVLFEPQKYTFKNLAIVGSGQNEIVLDGIASDKEDTLKVTIADVRLEYIHQLLNPKRVSFAGLLEGEAVIISALDKPVIQSDIQLMDMYLNKREMGHIDLHTFWNEDDGRVEINLINDLGSLTPIVANGYYIPDNDTLMLDVKTNNLRVDVLEPYLRKAIQNPEGNVTGNVKFHGRPSKPSFEGAVMCNNAAVNFDILNTRYTFNDSIRFKKNEVIFDDITIYDLNQNTGLFNGRIQHSHFKKMILDLNLEIENFNALNTRPRHSDSFYGTIFADGVVKITGENKNVFMDAKVTTTANSNFSLPVSNGRETINTDFITYAKITQVEKMVDKRERLKFDMKKRVEEVERDGEFAISLQVEATPDATVEIIFDRTVGDVITATGNGDISFYYSTAGDLEMNGVYSINKGEYLFTLLTAINKPFNIVDGSKITWGGDPFDALLDLNAVYNTKASLYDLMPGQFTTTESQKRIPVETHLLMKESLLKPDIKFDILLPTADKETVSTVDGIINTDDELNRQVLSLLLMNRFFTPDYMQNTQAETAGYTTQMEAAAVTASEFLTSQLSSWLSQISNDFDIGVKYRPGNEISSQEVEVAMSTQLLDDRVEINGNLGYRDEVQNTQTSNFVGDFDVYVKLNKQGNIKFKAYTHSNDEIFYETSPTIQGVGFLYKEDFNNFSDLKDIYKKRKIERAKRRASKKAKNDAFKSDSLSVISDTL